jgi:hypothetical protein
MVLRLGYYQNLMKPFYEFSKETFWEPFLGLQMKMENKIQLWDTYTVYKKSDIVTYTKVNLLRWAEHVIRLDEQSPTRRILVAVVEGKRQKGRPKLRWEDGVMDDARKLGEKTGGMLQGIRTASRSFWRRPGLKQGCCANDDDDDDDDVSSSASHITFPFLRSLQRTRPSPRLVLPLRIIRSFRLCPRPTLKLEHHLLSAVHGHLFNVSAATVHIWRTYPALSLTTVHWRD